MPCRTVEETQWTAGSSPARKIVPRMSKSPRPEISRAFVPPCIQVERRTCEPSRADQDCLSRTRRPRMQAGTLDAHLCRSSCKAHARAGHPACCASKCLENQRFLTRGPCQWTAHDAESRHARTARARAVGHLRRTGAARVGGSAGSQTSPPLESFCSRSLSVFMPEVARMRASICDLSSRNGRVCFMS